jgi:hypothetical protein
MKKLFLGIVLALSFLKGNAQVTVVAGDYKIINIGTNGYGDYTHALILLHQIFNGTLINHNYAVGTITAMRGNSVAFNRTNVVNVNTSSAYFSTSGTLHSYDDNASWALKTCTYNGNRYLAVDIPYADAYHDEGYYFSGWTFSTGETMKCVPYLVNGAPVNQSILSNIQDFSSNMVETHVAAGFNFFGNVGIGTASPDAKLTVNGQVHATSVVVTSTVPADYVFNGNYYLRPLADVKSYVNKNHHLPEVPPAADIKKSGQDLGEMNMLLLKKVEELTLYMIEKDKQLQQQKVRVRNLEKQVTKLLHAKK